MQFSWDVAQESLKKMQQAMETTKENAAETEKRVMEKVEEAVAEKTRMQVKLEEAEKSMEDLKEKLEAAEKCVPTPPHRSSLLGTPSTGSQQSAPLPLPSSSACVSPMTSVLSRP